jgi:hypothetical protein
MMNLEELSKTAGPHDLNSILDDLNESRGHRGRRHLMDLLIDDVSE